MSHPQRYIIPLIFIISCLHHSYISPLGQFNWLRPYDTLLIPDQTVCKGLQFNTYAEFGVKKAEGYNFCGEPTSTVMQIWGQTQDALSMLDGFPANSKIGQLNALINAPDDGIRGHFLVDGDLRMNWTFAMSARYFFWQHFSLSAYVPFYGLELKSVCWQDQTQENNADDLRVKEFLTNDIFQIAADLGGLNLHGWKREGPGDLLVQIEFYKEFPQINRPMLKQVDISGRLGFNIPTGKKQNENLLFAVPFGYDGAAGILGGAGIDLCVVNIMKLGVDVELLHLFGHAQCRRVKTAPGQTDLLFLQTLKSYKDYGLYQRFNLYAQVTSPENTLGVKLGYQFFKHNRDTIAFDSCAFSATIANTARGLDEWIMHHLYVVADYDAGKHLSDCAWAHPYISAYARIPLRGTNIALIPSIGVNITLSF